MADVNKTKMLCIFDKDVLTFKYCVDGCNELFNYGFSFSRLDIKKEEELPLILEILANIKPSVIILPKDITLHNEYKEWMERLKNGNDSTYSNKIMFTANMLAGQLRKLYKQTTNTDPAIEVMKGDGLPVILYSSDETPIRSLVNILYRLNN